MYDWNQTNTSVTISIPIPYKIDKRKVDYTITESYIKLNIPEMKRIQFVDLSDFIDINTSKMVIEDNQILFILQKINNGLWNEVAFKGTKDEMKQRRKVADEKLFKKINEERELATKKKEEFTQFATDRSIKIDDEKRDLLRGKKNEEKTKAEKDLYQFVNKMDNRENINNKYSTNKGIDEDDINTNVISTDNNEISTKKEHHESYTVNNKESTVSQKNSVHIVKEEKPENQIFNKDNIEELRKKEEENEDDIQIQDENKPIVIESPMVSENKYTSSFQKAYEESKKTHKESKQKEEVPKKEPPKPVPPQKQTDIREQKAFEVKLTEKKIPHFAARESLSKEPPYPKNKQYTPEKNYLGQEIEDKNPIWAKERADNFYNNHDYRSAINAYNKALDLDPVFHKCLLGRGTAYMVIGDFDNALLDFRKCIDLIDKMDPKEREDVFYDKILVRTYTKMYAVYALKQDYESALDIINNKLLTKTNKLPFITPEDKWTKIEKDRDMINNRMNNEKLKIEGDKLLSGKQFDKAKEIYLNILDIEPNNEKVLSNLSLIYLNENNYEEAIKCCTKILQIFNNFREKIRIKNMNNTFEIKILLRRAKCYEIKNEMDLAEKDIAAIERLEIKNEYILKDIREIKDKLKSKVVESYKMSANNYLAKGQFSEALSYYDKAISLIKYSKIYNKIDLVKILLNRTGCLIKLTQYDKTIDEFEKVLMILSKQKAIADIQSNIILGNEVKQLEFLTYVKRAYVYSISNKIDEAIKDYQNALKINPGDIKVNENLNKLKMLKN